MEAIEHLVKAREAARELLDHLGAAYVYINNFVPVEEGEINGFDVEAWCERAEQLLACRVFDPCRVSESDHSLVVCSCGAPREWHRTEIVLTPVMERNERTVEEIRLDASLLAAYRDGPCPK